MPIDLPNSPPEELDATQNAILDAVIVCLEKYGLAATTTRRIAQEAGVNEVTLFRRFGGKEEVLRQLFAREVRRIALEVRYTGALEADLTHVVQGYMRMIGLRGSLIMVMFSELPRHPELKGVTEGPLRVFGQVAALVKRYQDEGKLRPEPPGEVVGALIGPLLLSGIMGSFSPLLAMPDARKHVRMFLEGRSA